MAYIGFTPTTAGQSYRKIDDISGSFNGTTTSFAILVNGAAPVPFPVTNSVLISVGGVIQNPDDTGAEGFRISGTNIIFSSAPNTGEDFFGVILAGADYLNVGANFPDGTSGGPSITFDADNDTGFYRSGSGTVSFTSNAVQSAIFGNSSLTAPSFIPTTSTVPSNGVYLPATNTLGLSTGTTERVRLDSSGRFLLGTSTARSNFLNAGLTSKLQIEGTTGTDSWLSVVGNNNSAGGEPILLFGKSRGTTTGSNTVVQSGDILGQIVFQGADGTDFVQAASIGAYSDATPGADDMPGRLVFSTTADGASSPTERMRITNAGFVGIGDTAPDRQLTVKTTENGRWALSVQHTQTSGQLVHVNASNSSYADVMSQFRCDRAANTAWSFFILDSNYAVSPDREFTLRGDGNGFADGTWIGGGADYAEYFEWSDSNPNEEDRRGISVVLEGNKIREAVAGEDPIGVISGNPSVVGDAAWNKWSGKYLRDEFGSYLLDENGDRQLNSAYDPDQEYIPREQRPEWDCVGLMGKLRIRKGQVIGSRWIKMRDISDSVEEWLVR